MEPWEFLSTTRTALEKTFDALINSGVSATPIEIEHLGEGGKTLWLELRRQAVRSLDGWTIVTLVRDVTQRKSAEKRIAYLNRVRAFVSGIITLIVRVTDREELFKEACQIAVDHGQFKSAWIGMVDRDQMKVFPIASTGVDLELLTLLKEGFPLDKDAPRGNSMTARAIREKRFFASNDLLHDKAATFANEDVERGISSMVVLPLIVANEAVGVLALFVEEAGFFSEEEMRILCELTADIGFALDHLAKKERLDYLSYHDEVTGLANRELFLERISQYLKPREGAKNTMAVAIVDISRFRVINDTLGRQGGDELLKMVAQRLHLDEGGFDTIARVGVDAFGVAMLDPHDAAAVALGVDRLMRICFATPFQLQESNLRIAGKTGIALYPFDGEDAETLVRNAEAALMRAKRSAEPSLFYAPEMNTRVAAALDLESKMRTALDLHQFVLHYQPKVNAATGALVGVEALIRWNDPETGLVPPVRFIPILEETGLIYDVGRWALYQAVDDCLRWRNAGLPAVRVAVNVSPLQLRHHAFIAEIQQAVAIDCRAAAGLEIEITESVIMENVEHTIGCLRAIRAMNVTVAIDDFGTGFSSLGYLSKLPVDTLKIDRSFVLEMTASAEGLSLVSTIINLAHSLKLKVVAEGVESEEQARLLRLLNCDELQGFLYSKPLPSAVFEARFLVAKHGEPVAISLR